MNKLTAIKNYILFLSNELNLSISIHPIVFDEILYSSELIIFNIHRNSYCTHIKNNKETHNHCLCMQKKVFKKCNAGSFCGVCYAGVKEFIYPVMSGSELKAFISVSGYKTDNAESYHLKLSEKYGFDIKNLEKNYALLKPDNLSKSYIDTLIQPLCDMLELLFISSERIQKREIPLEEKIANYIKEVRNQDITSVDICKKFNYSRSYLSTRFNEYYGKSIPEYITDLRMADAMDLLKNSTATITEIAFCVGFSDANYFSNIFKKIIGITPSAYRKANK